MPYLCGYKYTTILTNYATMLSKGCGPLSTYTASQRLILTKRLLDVGVFRDARSSMFYANTTIFITNYLSTEVCLWYSSY